MEKITAREYARRHRKSLFEVIKMIQQGVLRGEQLEENGRSVQYVYLDKSDSSPAPADHKPSAPASDTSENLAGEITLLRQEIALLRRELRECCRRVGKRE